METLDQIKTIHTTPKMGLFVLFITELLERFSYYGMRAMIVLYMIDSSKIMFSQQDALYYYGIFTAAVYMVALPLGVITDLLIKQKRAVQLGGVILIIGYFLLSNESISFLFAGLTAITIGVGFVKPNLTVLVGRLFHKEDRKRDLGFMIYYAGINIGALLSGVVIYTVSNQMGYATGFMVVGFAMIISLMVFSLGKNYITEIETDLVKDTSNKEDANLLRILLIFVTIFLTIVFWGVFELYGGQMNNLIYNQSNFSIGSVSLPASIFQSLNVIFILLLSLIILGIWYFKGSGKTIPKFGVAFILFSIGFLLFNEALVISKEGGDIFGILVGVYFFHSLAEIFISPIALSFITRLSPVGYSSIFMGAYFLLTGIGNKIFGYVGDIIVELDVNNALYITSIAMIFLGIILILRKNVIGSLGSGID